MSGIVAAFETQQALEHALARLRAERIGMIETYTPKALTDDETGVGSPLPLMIFLAGMIGAAAMFGLETYADVVNWPVDVGGRPAFSWPAFVPIAFEVGVLFAITTGFFGYFIVNRMPRFGSRWMSAPPWRRQAAQAGCLRCAPTTLASWPGRGG